MAKTDVKPGRLTSAAVPNASSGVPQALTVKPMPPRPALLFFGGPTILYIVAIWVARPLLQRAGLSAPASTSWSVGSAAAVLTAVALIAYHLEGNPWSWTSFRTRYRLHAIRGTGWLWTLGLFAFMAVTVFGLSPVRDQVMARLRLTMPDVPFTSDPVGLGAVLVFVTLGEDLWWRGYVLPRQELAHGQWAWLVHGTGWTLFHLATWWELPTLWFGAVALALVCQRLKNTAPAMIVHFAFDFVSVLAVAWGLST